MSNSVKDAITGRDTFYMEGNKLYNAITGREVAIIPSGGGGSGGGQSTVTSGATTATLNVEPNTRYVFSNAVTKLTINSVVDSALESEIQFTAGSSITVELPASLGMIGEPSFEGGKSYVISFKNNIAVAAEYTPGVA